MNSKRVLFVCLGNICRSPTAEAVFRSLSERHGLSVFVDSAGTSDWHIGKAPDTRSTGAAKQRRYDLSGLRARQVSRADFAEFDYILAMDHDNHSALEAMRPEACKAELALFLDFSTQSRHREVPDPYHGGKDGFELVLDLIEDASLGLIKRLQ